MGALKDSMARGRAEQKLPREERAALRDERKDARAEQKAADVLSGKAARDSVEQSLALHMITLRGETQVALLAARASLVVADAVDRQTETIQRQTVLLEKQVALLDMLVRRDASTSDGGHL